MSAVRRVAWQAAIAAFLVTFAGGVAPALAQWTADTSHDASGQLKVTLMGDVSGGRTVYATCDTSHNTILALLVPASDPTLSTSGMTLSFAFPDGRRWSSRAALYSFDTGRVAVGYGNANDVPAIFAALATAKGFVTVGLETSATGPREWPADVTGSTAAARKFLDNCFPTN